MSNRQISKSDEWITSSTSSSNQSGSNDFVKKLFQMLQEDSYKDIVRWTNNGDSFVVLNTNEFTKEILPRHFKHSNFASFVRQLNKYDFHKVKIPNEEKHNYQYGENAWEFKHPDFRINDRESLENIKRKGPSMKKNNMIFNNNSFNDSQTLSRFQHLHEEIENIKSENKQLNQDINILQTKYKTLIENIIALKNFNERYYRSMGILINCITQAGIKLPSLDFTNPNLMNLQQPNLAHAPQPPPPPLSRHHQHSHSNDLTQISPPILNSGSTNNQQDLQSRITQQARFDQSFITQQSLQPSLQSIQTHTGQTTSNDTIDTTKNQSSQKLNNSLRSPILNTNQTDNENQISSTTNCTNDVISSTNLIKPKFHVLLVEDDNVCIQLCRKFLVKYGCQVTVVTDGLNAISTVEHTKYDLVLMDIVMPNLDGATATSVIRSFDTKTPIIAMTGNIENNDLVTYLQNGMSDILAKPFTKDDLYSILSKYLLSVESKSDHQNLQNSNQQNVILPSEQLSNVINNNDPIIKKQRLQ